MFQIIKEVKWKNWNLAFTTTFSHKHNIFILLLQVVWCPVLFGLIYKSIRERIGREQINVTRRHAQKIGALRRYLFSRDPLPITKRWLVNFTDVDVPPSVQRILQLGPNFCLPYATIPVKKLITDAEYAIQNSGAQMMTSNEFHTVLLGTSNV